MGIAQKTFQRVDQIRVAGSLALGHPFVEQSRESHRPPQDLAQRAPERAMKNAMRIDYFETKCGPGVERKIGEDATTEGVNRTISARDRTKNSAVSSSALSLVIDVHAARSDAASIERTRQHALKERANASCAIRRSAFSVKVTTRISSIEQSVFSKRSRTRYSIA